MQASFRPIVPVSRLRAAPAARAHCALGTARSARRCRPGRIARLLGFLAALVPLGAAAQVAGGPDGALQGFAIPQPGHVFSFPRDYGAHENFRIEWWYVTGHLFADQPETAAPRRFGFQATFFRLAGPRPKSPAADPDPADFSRREVFLAHVAVTDIAGRRFLHEERLNRAGWDARASSRTLDLFNGPWSLRLTGDALAPLPSGRTEPGALALAGSVDADASFDLRLKAEKPLVVFGENGVSRKGSAPSAASYYLTFSRLRATGRLTVGTTPFQVAGEAWMDHEISSSQLGSDQVGWDWTCIQLSHSPRELMLYRLRRRDGTADPASRLQWVSPDGKAIDEPFAWRVLSTWKSPRSHALYPARVELTTTDPATRAPVRLLIEPLLADQELTNALGGGPYWEGACRVLDAATGAPAGSAYLELTGYARALAI